MSEYLLKTSWERHKEHVTINNDIASRLVSSYSSKQVTACKLLSNGCANSNYQITFESGDSVLLRIYQREHSSLSRELGIHNIVKELLPVAATLYADDSCSEYQHPYAIMEFKEGILLRDLIFTHDETAISETVYEAGEYLGILRALKLPYGGFFDENMQIRPFSPEEEYEPYLIQLLQDNNIALSLGNNIRQDIQQLASQCYHLLPEINDANLTHGDYDPANILVDNVNGKWKITAILDWEFSFAGTYLLDVGMMLRYSHKLPSYFEKNLICGIESSGSPLPTDWKKQATLMDLICLLQLLQHNSESDRPHLKRDVIQLITHKVKHFTRI